MKSFKILVAELNTTNVVSAPVPLFTHDIDKWHQAYYLSSEKHVRTITPLPHIKRVYHHHHTTRPSFTVRSGESERTLNTTERVTDLIMNLVTNVIVIGAWCL